ncbi:hypothetical protein HK102_007871 [Quaeritorhiza haematococci]|nr:hypothetical protein HK102_007871 [Quaeritorhiza haematococci]
MSTSDPTAWRCLEHRSAFAPFSRDRATGLIQCLSFDSRDCTWSPNMSTCLDILASSPNAGASVCGEMHLQNFGVTGLDNPEHWCVVVDSRIPQFQQSASSRPASASPAPSGSPTPRAQSAPPRSASNPTSSSPSPGATPTAGTENTTTAQIAVAVGPVVVQRPVASNSPSRNTRTTPQDADISIQSSSSEETSSPQTVIIATSAFVAIATIVFIGFVMYLVRQRKIRRKGITITSEKTEKVPKGALVFGHGKKQRLQGTRDWDRLDEEEDEDEDFPPSTIIVGLGDQATVILQPQSSASSSFVGGDTTVVPNASMSSVRALIMGRLDSPPPSYPASAVSVRHTLHLEQQTQLELAGGSTTTSTTSTGMVVKLEGLDEQGDESIQRTSSEKADIDIHLLPAIPTTRLFPAKGTMDGELKRHSDVTSQTLGGYQMGLAGPSNERLFSPPPAHVPGLLGLSVPSVQSTVLGRDSALPPYSSRPPSRQASS